jgi:hypothetical protein
LDLGCSIKKSPSQLNSVVKLNIQTASALKSAFLTQFDSGKLPACLKLRLGLIFAKYRPK